MERLYQMLLAAGYPREGVDWLRHRRLLVIIVMGIAAWGVFIGIGSIIWRLAFG